MRNGRRTGADRFYWSAVFFFGAIITSIMLTAGPPDSADEIFYLEMKGGLPPNFIATNVRFSPDERFVAVAGGGTLYVYDVKNSQEVRRFLTNDNPFGTSDFDFSPSSDRLYARKGQDVLECPLQEGTPCSPIPQLDDKFNFAPLNPLVAISPDGSTSRNKLELGWKSPKGDLAIVTEPAEDGGQIISLRFLKTAAARRVILARSTSNVNSVDFFPGLLVTHGSSTHFIDFLQGTVQGLERDVRVGGMRRVLAYFDHPSPSATWDLAVQGISAAPSHPGLRLKKRPTWFRVSDDGDAVIYQENERTISGYAHGQSVDLNCDFPDFNFLRSPVSDPSGSSVGAFCRRDAKNPSAPGGDTVFVGWDLRTLKERVQVVAVGFDRAAAIGWDVSTVVLCGRKGMRIADLKAQSFSDVPIPNTSQYAEPSIVSLGATIALLGVNDLADNARLLWIDIATHQIIKDIPVARVLNSIAMDPADKAAVLTRDNVVTIYDRSGMKVAQFIALGPADWLVFSSEGMFDGSATALKWVGFRFSPQSPLRAAELFFNELYTPGLLSLIAVGKAPQMPSGMHLSTYYDLPGLKLFLENGDVSPMLTKDGKAVACVQRLELFATLRDERGLNVIEDNDPQCPRRVIFSDQSAPMSLIAALRELTNARLQSPWDGTRIKEMGGTVHLLGVAVNHYSQAGRPNVQTAVAATQRLEKILASRAAGDKVVDWNSACGGDLYDKGAKKVPVLNCLKKMAVAAKPSDMVMLIFAGHGGQEGDSEQFYYYPYMDEGSQEPISSAELSDVIRAFSARRIVIIVDACDGGAVVTPLQIVAFAKSAQRMAQIGANGSSAPPQPEGVLVLAAATGQENATSSSTANPFMDRLAALLNSADPQSPAFSSYALAAEMRKPLVLSSNGTSGIPIQPFTTTIGADFQIIK